MGKYGAQQRRVPLGTATAKRSSGKIHFKKMVFLKHSIQGPFITAGASKNTLAVVAKPTKYPIFS